MGAGCEADSNACYIRLPPDSDAPATHQSFRRSSSINKDAAEIVTSSTTPTVSTLVHELGHALGLSDYKECDKLRDQGKTHQDPDPNDQHYSLMAKSKAACRPIDESTVTGRDLRDLYEAYHVGAITNVVVDGDIYVGSKQIDDMMLPKVVEFTLRWGADGIEEASHGASHIVVLGAVHSSWSAS